MAGKWNVYQVFKKSRSVRKYLPPTSVYSRSTLRQYMKNYGSVFIKPNRGSTGKGVIKAWRMPRGYTFVKVRGKKAAYTSTVEGLYRKLNIRSSEMHIIQKTIQLPQIKGCPLDIRVMVMRDRNHRWKHVGMLAKIAGHRSIVTNVQRSRGYVLTVKTALTRSGDLSQEQARGIVRKLKSLGLRVARLTSNYRYTKEVGVDFGVDRNGEIWIIESNRWPSHVLFHRLKDKTIYRKIQRMEAKWRKKKR